MPILVECEVCGKGYRVAPDRAGTVIPCKQCGADMFVPGRARRQPTRNRNKRGSGRTLLAWVLGGAAFVLAFIVAFVAVGLLTGGNDQPQKPEQARPAEVEQQPPAPAVAGNQQAGPNRNDQRPRPNRPMPSPPERSRQFPRLEGDGRSTPAGPTRPTPRTPPNPVAWNVEPDPAAQPLQLDPQQELRIPVPEQFPGAHVVLPTAPSPFAVIGRNDKQDQTSAVYDLRTQEKVGLISGIKVRPEHSVLSPDGSYFAASSPFEEGVLVWDVRGQKLLGGPQGSETLKNPSVFDFAGADRLLAAGFNEPLIVWQLPSGQIERQIDLPQDWWRQATAISPGGRYIAIIHNSRKTLRVYDLTTGQPAGDTPVPTIETDQPGTCRGLRFSPDGRELAGLFEHFGRNWLVVWDATTGRVAVRHEFDERLRTEIPGGLHYSSQPIEWFPDNSKWLLYGHAIVDRRVGGPVLVSPQDPAGHSPRRVVAGGRILTMAGPRKNRFLTALPVPTEQIEKGIAALESGGTAADADLPTLTSPNRSAMQTVELSGTSQRWSVPPDPAPQFAEDLLAKPQSLDLPIGSVRGAMLARSETPLLVVDSTPQTKHQGSHPPDAAQPGQAAASVLRVINLIEQKEQSQTEIPVPGQLMDVDPEVTRCLMRFAGDGQRLDVWSLQDGSHVLGWRPYQHEEEDGNRTVQHAVFIDETRVLTQSAAGTVVLWELPDCRALYALEARVPLSLSPGGRYMAARTQEAAFLVESLSGRVHGRFPDSQVDGPLTFHPGGARVAALQPGLQSGRMLVWNATNGSLEKDFRVATRDRAWQWCGDNYLISRDQPRGQRRLVDVNNELVVWTYQLGPRLSPVAAALDDRFWFLAPRSLREPTAYAFAVRLPHEQASAELADRRLEPEVVLGPGKRVSLQINFQVPGEMRSLGSQFKKKVSEALNENGIRVAPASPLVLQARVSKTNTGKTLQYTLEKREGRFGLAQERQDLKIPETHVQCRVEIKHRGEVVSQWQRNYSNDLAGLFGVDIPEGKSAQQHLEEQQWKNAKNGLLGYTPPEVVYVPQARYGFGYSRLTPGGPVPMQVPGQSQQD